jgi:hypothetical protein
MKKVVFNPYASVDFATFHRFKGNWHTHTRQSYGDGYNLLPDGVADYYANFGYDILSITDHDTLNTPRTGTCDTNGTVVTLSSVFTVYGGSLIQPGESTTIIINSVPYTMVNVELINNKTVITITESAGVQTGVPWRYDFINTPDPNWNGIPTWALNQWHDDNPTSGSNVAEIYEGLGTSGDKKMLMVCGNEISQSHHLQSLFTRMWLETGQDWASRGNVNYTLQQIKDLGGISFLCHPGRYTGFETVLNPTYTVQWYIDKLNAFDNCIGLEVYNAGNRHWLDRVLWDAVLLEMMPSRPVFGLSNTDDHGVAGRCGINYNIHLMPELTEAAMRNNLLSGASYFVYDPLGTQIARHNPVVTPIINSIDVTPTHIEIDADNYTSIKWISGCNLETFESTTVHTGDTLPLNTPGLENYVRAILVGANGSFAYTQPFGFEVTELSGNNIIMRSGSEIKTLQAVIRQGSEIKNLDVIYKP